MRKVKIVKVTANADCTYTVTLELNNERVTCADIMLWDSAQADKYLFNEWMELALTNTEGYTYSVA